MSPEARRALRRILSGQHAEGLPDLSPRSLPPAALRVIGSLADALDMQEHADEDVRLLPDEIVGGIYRILTADRAVLFHHTPLDEVWECAADGERWPCAQVQTALARYL